MLAVDEITVSGHACYTFSMRTGCKLEEASDKIKEMLPLATQLGSEYTRQKKYKKHRQRIYFRYDEYIFVLNQDCTAVITLLTKDLISKSLFT
jgi:hypothetical protein